MSSDSNHHSNNQQQLHNHYEFHNGHGLMQNREHEARNRASSNEQLEARELLHQDALIRGNSKLSSVLLTCYTYMHVLKHGTLRPSL